MKTKINEISFENFIWIDVCRPDSETLESIAKDNDLNYLLILDSMQVGHLPKFEKTDNYNFLILRSFSAKPNRRITNINELSNKIAFFYNEKKIITIHRSKFSFLENTPNNFVSTDELLLHIVSCMVDSFVEPSELLSNKVDEIEKTIFLKDYTKISLEDLYFQKSQTRISKKLLQITQNVVNQINVNPSLNSVIQDIKDKLLSLILNYDEVLEDSYNLLHTFLSVNSQKSNDVMKLLTIFSAFFLPLTFIAGIYGMNFENMPELKWEVGYFIILCVMVIIAAIIYAWFKKKKII